MLFEKSGNFFHRVNIEIGLTPPLPLFVFIRSLRTPLHNKPFIKKGSLEEMEGVNDNASAFMHLNIKANKYIMAKNYFLNQAKSFTWES